MQSDALCYSQQAVELCVFVGSDNPNNRVNWRRALSAAARLVCGAPRHCHVTPQLLCLHRLPVTERTQCQVLLFVFKLLRGIAPEYIKSLVELQSGSKYNLSSTNSRLLDPFKGKTKTMGHRSFAGGLHLHSRSGTHCHLRDVRSRTLARLEVNLRHISLVLLFISRNINLTIAFLCNAIIIILDLT